jgi:hypothetical protein
MKLNAIAASIALTAGVAFAGAAQAAPTIIIDDWNINADTGNFITDPPTASPSTLSRTGPPTGAVGGISLPRGNLYLNKTAGPDVNPAQVVDCFVCQAGTFSNASGVISNAYWSWTPSNLDLTGYSTVNFDYRADLTGADVVLSFFSGGVRIGNILQRSDLAGTGDAFVPISFNLADVGAPLVGVDAVFLDVFAQAGNFADPNRAGLGTLNLGIGLDDLDFRIDNLRVPEVPEPGTIALLGLALAGLGVARRRRG